MPSPGSRPTKARPSLSSKLVEGVRSTLEDAKAEVDKKRPMVFPRWCIVYLHGTAQGLVEAEGDGKKLAAFPWLETLRASAAPPARQYVRNDFSPASQSKNFSADAGRRCTQNTQIVASEQNELSGRLVGCAFTVLNTLRAGFLDLLINDVLLVEMRPSKGWTTRIECNAPII